MLQGSRPCVPTQLGPRVFWASGFEPETSTHELPEQMAVKIPALTLNPKNPKP